MRQRLLLRGRLPVDLDAVVTLPECRDRASSLPARNAGSKTCVFVYVVALLFERRLFREAADDATNFATVAVLTHG